MPMPVSRFHLRDADGLFHLSQYLRTAGKVDAVFGAPVGDEGYDAGQEHEAGQRICNFATAYEIDVHIGFDDLHGGLSSIFFRIGAVLFGPGQMLSFLILR